VLTQIIVEQESRTGGQTLLPIPFLRQLIRFYDDSIGKMVPPYLQFSLETLAKEQEKFRSQFANAFGNPAAAFEAYQEQARKNMAIFEQAMQMWTPFGVNMGKRPPGEMPAPGDQHTSPPQPASVEPPSRDELGELKAQLAAMQAKIEKLSDSK